MEATGSNHARHPPHSLDQGYTIVLPIRGTPRERETFPKAIRSACRLNPSALLMVVDTDAPEYLVPEIRETMRQYEEGLTLEQRQGMGSWSILEVDHSADPWNFRLAKCIWEAYSSVATKRVLSFDCDSELTKNVLIGLEEVGPDNVVVTFHKKLGGRRTAWLEHILMRSKQVVKQRRRGGFSGIYWVWLPAYFELVDREEFSKIYNGVDTYLMDVRLQNSPQYGYKCHHEIGSVSHDIQQQDYAWHQFMRGIWLAAHGQRVFRRHPAYFLWALAWFALGRKSWVIRGHRWGRQNPDSAQMREAASKPYPEWMLGGARVVAGIRDFPHQDRTGYYGAKGMAARRAS